LGGVSPQPGVLEGLGAIIVMVWVFLLVSRLHEIIAIETGVPFRVFRLLYPLGAILWLVSGGAYRTFSNRVGLGFALLTGWLVAGVPFSSWRGGTVNWLADYWAPNTLTFLVCAALLFSLVHWRRLVRAIGWATPLIAAFTVVSGTEDRLGRVSAEAGTLGNANEVVMYILLGLPFWLQPAGSRETSMLRKLLIFGSLPALAMVVLRTGSRAGVLAALVVVLMYLLRLRLAARVAVIAALAVLGLVAVTALPESVRARLATLTGPEAGTEVHFAAASAAASAEFRRYLLMMSIEIAVTRPLFGAGAGRFPDFTSGLEAQEGRRGSWREAHNTYTQIAAEGGIPALVFFLLALTGSFQIAWRTYRSARQRTDLAELADLSYAFLVSLTALALSAFFGSIHHLPLFPMIFGLAISLWRTAQPALQSMESAAPGAARPPGPVAPLRAA
jgi:O-antigen ligase